MKFTATILALVATSQAVQLDSEFHFGNVQGHMDRARATHDAMIKAGLWVE